MKKMKWKNYQDVTEALGIYDLSDKYPSEISGGQQQRTAAVLLYINHPSFCRRTNRCT